MNKVMERLRGQIGVIIAAFGFALLTILIYGDIGEITSEEYWKSVLENLTSIGFMSISMTMIQTSIKQGLGEQALQRGLNTDNTTLKYEEHKALQTKCRERIIYMPYFLKSYNERHTLLRKREYLVDNGFTSEQKLFESKNKRLIYKYNKICTHITASRIKWSTTDIKYNKHGQIQTLTEYRVQRTAKGIFWAFIFMLGGVLLTRGLFFESSADTIGQKTIKLLTCVLMIALTSILAVIKAYEKGAFGVPNELEEVNQIWREFDTWNVPQWVIDEVKDIDNKKEEITENEKSNGDDCGRVIQAESEEIESI